MYTCTFCVAEGGDPVALTFKNDVDWLDHLCCPDHAAKQRMRGAKKTFAHWDDKRTLVVSGIFGLKLRSLVNYFAGLGDLQNFYYVHKVDGTSNYCKALMADEKSAKKIHKTGHHTIGGVTFQTRLQNQPSAKAPPASVMPSTSAAAATTTATVSAKTDISSTSSSSVPTSTASSTVSSSTTPRKVSDKFRRLHGTDAGGFVAGVGYRCRICEQVVGIGEEKWVQHLISKEHQDIHRTHQHLRKILWELDHAIKICRVKGMNSVHILRYVIAFGGPVVDFSYLAKKDGGTPECFVLFGNRDGPDKLLTKSKESHCIGPQRRKVRMLFIKEQHKLKWRKWRDSLLRNIGEDPAGYISLSEEEDDDEDDQVKVKEISSSTTAVVQDKLETKKDVVKPKPVLLEDVNKKRKSSELSPATVETGVRNVFPSFAGLSLAQQLEKIHSEFGWNSKFLNSAVKFVDQTVGSLHLKHKKIPFGDLTTGLGLQSLPTLQLLVDVQEILETKPDSANTLILSMVKNCSQTLGGLKAKMSTVHPILKIWTTESEVCLNTRIETVAACLKLRFSNTLPFHECTLFKFCTDVDSRILPMSFIIGHWATSNNFLQYSKQSYPNQLIVLMILSYLQLKKVLPTVQKLIEICPESEPQKMINGNTVSFCMDLATVKKLHPNPLESVLKDNTIHAMSVLGLLRDWFEFFATSDLKENAVCSRFGVLIPKKDFQPDSVGNLPGDLCRVYRFGMSKGDRDRDTSSSTETTNMKKFLCSQTSLCIQNPFDLSLNCSRGVTPNEVLRFQNGCKEASSILSTLLTCDQPDLTRFLSLTIPPVENKTTNVNKKVKIDEVIIHTTPRKSDDSVVSITSNMASDKVPASSSAVAVVVSKDGTQASGKKVASPSVKTPPSNSKVLPKDKTPTPTKGSKTPTPRRGAADFFDSIIEPIVELSDSGDEDDGEDDDEDGSMDDNESVVSDATNKDCTITLNVSLFKYFERAFPGTRDMKFKKCQLLILQHILDFNSKFWTNCLGLVFLPKVGQKFWSEDFSKVVGEGKIRTDLTLLQKIMAVSESENEINLNFRIKSEGGIIHKMFAEEDVQSLRPKDWASGKTLTECSLLLFEEVPESRLEEIKSATFVNCNQLTQAEISFECRLLGSVFNTFSNSTPLATLTMNVLGGSAVHVGTNYARIDVIKALYRKLGMTYINKMVKRWLVESKDFDHTKAFNFVQHRNQQWNRKANRKRKNLEKKKLKQQGQTPSPKIPVLNPRHNSQGSASFRPKQEFSQKTNFRPPPPVNQRPPFGRGRGYNSPPRTPQFNSQQQQPPSNFSGSGMGRGIGIGRGRPFPDQYNYHDHQQQQYNGPSSYYEPHPPSSERILRNPGAQGMRTFYPPHQQSSQTQPAHLLPNPQFTTNQNQRSYNGFVEGIDNTELSFQSLPPQAHQQGHHHQPFHHGFIPNKVGININEPRRPLVPNPQYQNNSAYPSPLLPTPTPGNHYFPVPQPGNYSDTFSYQQQYHHQPKSDYPPFPYNNGQQEQQHHHRYEPQQNRFEAPSNDQLDLPPLIYNPHFSQRQDEQFPNPNYGHKPSISNNLNPNIRHFSNNPISLSSGHQGPAFTHREQFPIKSNPSHNSSFENSYSRPDRPQNPTFPFPNAPNNNMQTPVFDNNRRHNEDQRTGMQTSAARPSRYFNVNSNNNNHTHSFNSSEFPFETRTSLPSRETSYGCRPSQPKKRGFVSGGYLSTQRVDESDSDDDLQIVYDVDPKGNSSPPPPPLKKYKIGPAFPVPSKPSSRSGRTSVSPPPIYRNPLAEQRRGYLDEPRNSSNLMNQNQYSSASFSNRMPLDSPPALAHDSGNDFQDFGFSPRGRGTSQYYGGQGGRLF